MWKATIMAAGALALIGTTVLMAQEREPPHWWAPGMMQGEEGDYSQSDDGLGWHGRAGIPGWHRWGRGMEGGRRQWNDEEESDQRQWTAEDMRAFADARIAALHAGLALRPDQEKDWPAFEQALRAAANERMDRLETRGKEQQQPPTNPIERLKRVADALSRRGAVLKQIADAAAPLYQSLDDGQKERFRILSRATIRLQMRGWSLENR